MKNFRLKIYCDIDSIYKEDSCLTQLLRPFIYELDKADQLRNSLASGRISKKYFTESVMSLVSGFNSSMFKEHLGKFSIDEAFDSFVRYCSDNSFEVYLLNSGFNELADDLTNRAGINLPSCSLTMKKDASEKIDYVSEYSDEYCDECLVCYRNVLVSNTNDLDNEISVFIGNSVNGSCVSSYADIVFAKGPLASYCWKRNITYFEFRNYSDIEKKLRTLSDKNKIKQRQEARFRRKEILIGG